jgi:hypothetical protein
MNRSRESDLYVMEKAFYSEQIHKLIRYILNWDSLVPLRNRKRKRVIGYYQRQIARSFDERMYYQRNIGETVISVPKRKFREALKDWLFKPPIKEIKIKILLYNILIPINSFVVLIVVERFYRHDKMIFC